MVTIRKRNIGEWLILFIIVFSVFGFGIKQSIGLPGIFNYIADAAVIFLFILEIVEIVNNGLDIKFGQHKLILWMGIFFIYAILAHLWNFQSAYYLYNGIRNTFRFYAFFIGCILFLRKSEIEFYFKIFDVLLWINVVLCTFQFFVLGKKADFLGGIFGVVSGCNAYMNLFLIVVMTRSILLYLQKKEKTKICLMKFLGTLYIASLAEIKIIFFELLLIIILATFFTNFTWRKLIMIVGGILLVFLGMYVLLMIFPAWKEYFSINGILDIITSEQGYTGSGDLNRLTAVQSINELFFNRLPERLFGYGIGNCDYAAMNEFVTPFYRENSYLHYTWMSTAIVYLETGYIGLIFYFGFFIIIFYQICRYALEKRNLNVQFGKIIAILCIVVGIYNNSLRTDAGYLLYLVLAFAFVKDKDEETERESYI